MYKDSHEYIFAFIYIFLLKGDDQYFTIAGAYTS